MVKVRKMALAAAFASACMLAGAQTTPLASPVTLGGLAGEVEDYMDVNSFSSVEFDKFFGYAGWSDVSDDDTDNPVFNIGAAKVFSGIYTGLFFAGDFYDFTTGSSSTSVTEPESSSKGNTSGTTAADGFTLSAIAGVAGYGIKGSILYVPSDNTATSKTKNKSENNDYTVIDDVLEYEIYPEIRVGTNLTYSNWGFSPYGYFGLDVNKNSSKDSTKGTVASVETDDVVKSDTSTNYILFGFGSGFAMPSKEGDAWVHNFAAALDFNIATEESYSLNQTIEGDTKNISETKTTVHGDSVITFTPQWKGTFAPMDKLTLTLKASLPFAFTSENDERMTVTKTNDGTTETETTSYSATSPVKTTTTDITPALSFGLAYQIKPNFGLHVGADVTLPTAQAVSTTTVYYDTTTDERKEVSRSKTTSFAFTKPTTGSDFDLAWNSGFRFDLTKNVTFDCSYSFMSDLFTNFSTNPSGTTIWGTLDTIIFHKLDFLVTIKL